MMKAVVSTNSASFCVSPGSILNPNVSLLPMTMPNTNTAKKPEACRPSAAKPAEITATSVTRGAYSVRKAHRSAGDQKCCEITERNSGDNADHRLLDECDDGMHEREFAGAGRNRHHGERQDRAHPGR